MRVGSSLLFINGLCYQSYNWNCFRPLGDLQNAVKHLDSYKIDEISIIRPIRISDKYLNQDLKILKNLKSSTPIAFGGGIRSLNDLNLLEGMPIERVIVSSILFEKNTQIIDNITELYGKQAVVGFIPFEYTDEIKVFNSSKDAFFDRSTLNPLALQKCDEIVLHDCTAEGSSFGFNYEALNYFEKENVIISGGVAGEIDIIKNLIPQPRSVLIENKVLHLENSKRSFYGKM